MFYQKSPKVPNMRQNSHYPYSSSPEPAAPPPLHFCSYRLAAGAFWPRSLPPPQRTLHTVPTNTVPLLAY